MKSSTPPDDSLASLMSLYIYERQDIGAMLQLELALVGAGLSYLVPVFGLIAMSDPEREVLYAAPLPVLAIYSFLIVLQLNVELQSQYVDRLEEEVERRIGGEPGSLRIPVTRRKIVRRVYVDNKPSLILGVLAQSGIGLAAVALVALVASKVEWSALTWVVAGAYAAWICALVVVAIQALGNHGGQDESEFSIARPEGGEEAGS